MTMTTTNPRSLLCWSLVLLFKAPTVTDASAYLCDSSCNNFRFSDSGEVRELCFSGSGYGPSPAVLELEDGTSVVVYTGGYSQSYYFEDDLDGLTTNLQWDGDESGTCLASVNGQNCTSCTLCKNAFGVRQGFNADCTNLGQGRNVICELDDPFFPLVPDFVYDDEEDLVKEDANATLAEEGEDEDATAAPTRAPVPAETTISSGPEESTGGGEPSILSSSSAPSVSGTTTSGSTSRPTASPATDTTIGGTARRPVVLSASTGSGSSTVSVLSTGVLVGGLLVALLLR